MRRPALNYKEAMDPCRDKQTGIGRPVAGFAQSSLETVRLVHCLRFHFDNEARIGQTGDEQ